MFNLQLAVGVLAQIELSMNEATDFQWDQSQWARMTNVAAAKERGDVIVDEETGKVVGYGTCGTAACFAGWGLSLSRVKMVWEYVYDDVYHAQYAADGREIATVARELLRIPDCTHHHVASCDWGEDCEQHDPLWDYEDDMPALFAADNDLDDLYRIVATYADLDVQALRSMVAQDIEQMSLATKRNA